MNESYNQATPWLWKKWHIYYIISDNNITSDNYTFFSFSNETLSRRTHYLSFSLSFTHPISPFFLSNICIIFSSCFIDVNRVASCSVNNRLLVRKRLIVLDYPFFTLSCFLFFCFLLRPGVTRTSHARPTYTSRLITYYTIMSLDLIYTCDFTRRQSCPGQTRALSLASSFDRAIINCQFNKPSGILLSQVFNDMLLFFFLFV